MTTAELLSKVYSFQLLKDSKLSFGDSDIKLAANFAQAEILVDTEMLEETQTLDFVADQAVYTTSDEAWLSKVFRVKDPMYYTDSTKGVLVARSKQWVDTDRERVAGGGGAQSYPRFYYPLKTSPLSLGFWAVPTSALSVKVSYIRQHVSADDISDTVDPLIPDTHQRCLLLGIAFFILDDAGVEFADAAMLARQKFEAEKQKVLMRLGRVDQSINPQQNDIVRM